VKATKGGAGRSWPPGTKSARPNTRQPLTASAASAAAPAAAPAASRTTALIGSAGSSHSCRWGTAQTAAAALPGAGAGRRR
jgi:hypothetical protein